MGICSSKANNTVIPEEVLLEKQKTVKANFTT